jgi:hypothetical protein
MGENLYRKAKWAKTRTMGRQLSGPILGGDFGPGELSHSSMLALLLRVRNGRRHPLFNRPESSKEKGYDR